jgi:hypothetical protein
LKDQGHRNIHAKTDHITMLQRLPRDFAAVHENPSAVPTIFENVAISFNADGGAFPGHAIVGNDQMIAFIAAAHAKWRFRNADRASFPAWRTDFDCGFTSG